MLNTLKYYDFVPELVPKKMIGTITRKIWMKKDHVKTDGSCSIYIDLYQKNGLKITRKRIPLNISVPISMFDSKKQRVKNKHKYAKDYNLLIEKKLAEINTIEVNYRLSNQELTIKRLLEDLNNPGLRISIYRFWEDLMTYQKDKQIIAYTTFKQQRATLNKLKEFKSELLFAEITEDYLNELRAWLKNVKQQAPNTVEIVFKNLKKYIRAANKKGIKTPIDYSDIKVRRHKSNFTFLMPNEVKALYDLYMSDGISQQWKNLLQRYLFSCFTGVRISDIKSLTQDNFIDDILVFISHKSKKLQRIKLNNTALGLIEFPYIFNGSYCEQVGNRDLKMIAEACDIKKRLYFHSGRHTFATNYLIAGGQIRNLQKVLGHSKLETTEVYAHAVDSLIDKDIEALDGIIN